MGCRVCRELKSQRAVRAGHAESGHGRGVNGSVNEGEGVNASVSARDDGGTATANERSTAKSSLDGFISGTSSANAPKFVSAVNAGHASVDGPSVGTGTVKATGIGARGGGGGEGRFDELSDGNVSNVSVSGGSRRSKPTPARLTQGLTKGLAAPSSAPASAPSSAPLAASGGGSDIGFAAPSYKVRQSILTSRVHRSAAAGAVMFSKYELTSEIVGTGVNGAVRVAVERGSGRRYAVKTLSLENISAKKAAMLQNEVDIYLKLDHPNIAKLVEVFEDKSKIALIMELCTGRELYERLAQRKRYSETSAARVAEQMLQAVNYCHLHRICHRDLKLENWVYAHEGEHAPLKLIDFGFSRIFNPVIPMTAMHGTVYYVSPEVMDGCYREKCDIWSLGVICFMLLAGSPPFNGKHDYEILIKIRNADYTFDASWTHISDAAKNFVASLLQRDPNIRPSAAVALKHPWILKHTRLARRKTKPPASVVVGDDDGSGKQTAIVEGAEVPSGAGTGAGSREGSGDESGATFEARLKGNGYGDSERGVAGDWGGRRGDEIRGTSHEREDPRVTDKNGQTPLVESYISQSQSQSQSLSRSESIDLNVLRSMRQFALSNVMKRAAIGIVANKFTTADVHDLQLEFKKIDRANTGCISFQELARVLQKSLKLDEAEAAAIFSKIDSTGDQEVHYTEFLAATFHTKLMQDDVWIHEAFGNFDADADGKISLHDLRSVLGDNFNNVPIENIMKSCLAHNPESRTLGENDGDKIVPQGVSEESYLTFEQFKHAILCPEGPADSGTDSFRTHSKNSLDNRSQLSEAVVSMQLDSDRHAKDRTGKPGV